MAAARGEAVAARGSPTGTHRAPAELGDGPSGWRGTRARPRPTLAPRDWQEAFSGARWEFLAGKGYFAIAERLTAEGHRLALWS